MSSASGKARRETAEAHRRWERSSWASSALVTSPRHFKGCSGRADLPYVRRARCPGVSKHRDVAKNCSWPGAGRGGGAASRKLGRGGGRGWCCLLAHAVRRSRRSKTVGAVRITAGMASTAAPAGIGADNHCAASAGAEVTVARLARRLRLQVPASGYHGAYRGYHGAYHGGYRGGVRRSPAPVAPPARVLAAVRPSSPRRPPARKARARASCRASRARQRRLVTPGRQRAEAV